MKRLTKISLILLSTITFTITTHAHDPSLHVKKAEKADCSKMDHGKMDASDPVAVAMMRKCKKQAEAAGEEMDHDDMGNDSKSHDEMNHDDMKKAESATGENSEHDHTRA